MHLSALQQATGEAIYVDDMPSYKDELYAAIVDSTRPHAEIVNIDISEAKEVEGFVDFISVKDIPEQGSNKTGVLDLFDEEVFADEKVAIIIMRLVKSQNFTSSTKTLQGSMQILVHFITLHIACKSFHDRNFHISKEIT